MNFCLVYLRSRLPCILGRLSRFRITNSCSGTWRMVGARVLKCFLLPSSTLSKNTFSSEGNGRDFLTSQHLVSSLKQKLCVQARDRWADYDVYVLDRWADWGIFRIGDLRLLGEITDCRRNHDQPSLFAAPWAERLHYQPTTNWCPSDTLVEW